MRLARAEFMTSAMTKFSRSVSFAAVAPWVVIATALFGAHTPASAGGVAKPPTCDPARFQRTPLQVISEHLAFIQDGHIDAAMCDFARRAVVLLPDQVVEGRDAIRVGLEGFSALLGGAVPEVTSLTSSGPVVLLTFTAEGTPYSIPDGSDTYIVVGGQIIYQTVHATWVPTP